MLTRKHFRMLANAIRDARPIGTIDAVVDRLCAALREDNPRFDARRFRDACRTLAQSNGRCTLDRQVKRATLRVLCEDFHSGQSSRGYRLLCRADRLLRERYGVDRIDDGMYRVIRRSRRYQDWAIAFGDRL